jgi:hypothetical protein
MGMADIVPKLRALTTNIALGHLTIHSFRKAGFSCEAGQYEKYPQLLFLLRRGLS